MTDRKPLLQTYSENDAWKWRVWSPDREVIAVSTESYQTRHEAEAGAANTLVAIIEETMKALSLEKTMGKLLHMKPAVEGIMKSAGLALIAIRDAGYYTDEGLTEKGKALVEANLRAELKREHADLELSKAMPPLVASLQIPVQYTDQPVAIMVRVK